MTNIYGSYFENRKVYRIQPNLEFFKNLFVVNLVFNWKSLSKENCVPENFK